MSAALCLDRAERLVERFVAECDALPLAQKNRRLAEMIARELDAGSEPSADVRTEAAQYVVEYKDGAVWLLCDSGAPEEINQRYCRRVRAEHKRRLKAGLPTERLLRARKAGETVYGEDKSEVRSTKCEVGTAINER